MIADTQGQDETVTVKKKKLNIKSIALFSLLVPVLYFISPLLAQWYNAIPSVKLDSVQTAKVTKGDLIRDVAVNGKVVAAHAPQLYNTEQGQVTFTANPGEQVVQGQVVAIVESPELVALIKQQTTALEQLKINNKREELKNKESLLNLESQLNSAISAQNVAKREQQRAQQSYQKQVLSEVDWMKSNDQLEDANRNYVHAQKRVALATESLSFENKHRDYQLQQQQLVLDELLRRQQDLNIKAPVTGVVGNWLVAQKSKLGLNTPIMSIVDLSEYEAELNVPEFYADDIKLGLAVSMKIGGYQITGKIIAISPEINGNQVQVRAQLIMNDDIQLRQNQRLNARIELEKKTDVLMVKKGPFLASLGGKQAYLLGESNTAKKVSINVGAISVEQIELINGVSAGDTLIISDYQEYQHANEIKLN